MASTTLPRPPAAGTGMAARVAAFDWSRTSLGPAAAWPRSLRTVVEMMLAHPMPMILMWGPDLVQVYNDGYAAMAGGKHPGALGQPTRECWPEVWHLNAPLYERVLRGESVRIDDALFPIDRDGTVQDAWFTLAFGPLRDDDGAVAGFLLTATEVTHRVLAERERERRRAEQAVREAEALHRSAAEAGRTGSWYLLADTLECALSPMTARLMGWPADRRTATAAEWRERVAPEHRPALEAALAASVARGAPFDLEFRIVLDDGTDRWLYSRADVVRDEATGRPVRLHGASVDVTDRKRAEDRLRRSHDTFFSLIQNNPFGVYLVDADFRLRQVSLGAQKVFEGVPRPLLGRDFGEVLRHIWAEPFASDAVALFRRTLATGEPYASPSTVERRQDLDATEAYDWRIERVTLPDGRFGVVCYFYDLSDRLRWEAALRESEARAARQARLFEQIASTTPDFIYVFGLDFRFLYANRRLLEVWGRTYDDAVGRSLAELGYPDWHVAMHERELRQVVATGRPIKGEVPFTGGSGISGVYEYIFTPVLGPDGAVEVIAGTTRDVTDRRRTERALLEATAAAEAGAARWRAVVESMADGVVVADADGNLPEWNPAALAMHGYGSLEEVRRHLTDFPAVIELAAADGRPLPLADWPMSRILRGEAFAGAELTVRRRDTGLVRVISYGGSPVRDRDGRVALGVLTLHDVTEARRAQAALAESERRFRELADAMPQMVWVTRPDGFHEYYNRRWYEFTGTAEGATDGAGWNGMFHPDDRDRAWAAWRRSLETGEPYEIEYRLRDHTGAYRWTLGRALPVRDAAGAIARWFGTCTDIDALKRLQQERERLLQAERAARASAEASAEQARASAAEAERQGRVKDEFLATLSHELRTPLNAILGWAQVLRRTTGDADVRHGLDVIERNARAQTRIVEDLLEMSRIVAGKVRLDVGRVDLAAVVEAAVNTVRHAADAKGVGLDVALDRAVGPVSGDPARLQQVFWNLLSNSVKHTPRGGRVRVRLARAGPHAEVAVADDGEGIAPDFLPHVFDRFRQADGSTTRRHGGLGLGLSIVKQLVELHGGSVTARSPGTGGGSTFTVTIPLAAAADAPPAAAAGRGHPHDLEGDA
ncbi:MAG TPA: PAS domain S-box protein, partial [Humisphaera sp.]